MSTIGDFQKTLIEEPIDAVGYEAIHLLDLLAAGRITLPRDNVRRLVERACTVRESMGSADMMATLRQTEDTMLSLIDNADTETRMFNGFSDVEFLSKDTLRQLADMFAQATWSYKKVPYLSSDETFRVSARAFDIAQQNEIDLAVFRVERDGHCRYQVVDCDPKRWIRDFMPKMKKEFDGSISIDSGTHWGKG